MTRTLTLAAVVVGLCACASNDSLITTSVGEDENFEYFIDGDMVIPVPHREQVFLASGGTGPGTVFLNFEGGLIKREGWRQDNAQNDASFIVDQDRTVPAFDASHWSGTRAAVIASILTGVQQDFAPYGVEITDERPLSGAYTMIIVGGRPSDIGRSGNLLGIAPFDSSNWNPSDVGFVFSDAAGEKNYHPRHLAHVISHELGHTVGLNHISRDGDIMRPSACHCTQTWGAGPISTDPSTTQDDDALLRAAFPLVGTSPIGSVNSLNDQGHLRGWACDQDNALASVEVMLSIGGIAGSGAPTLTLTADRNNGAAVTNQCGGGSAHRFATDIGLQHCGKVVHAYGLNLPGTGGSTVQLTSSPISMPGCPVVEPPPPPPPPAGDSWIGSSCSADSACSLQHANVSDGECLSWFDEDSAALHGFCSKGCAGFCPDLIGEDPTFCAEVQGAGQCVAIASTHNSQCSEVPGTAPRAKPRFVGASGVSVSWRNVCLPAHEALACSAGGSSGECIDTGAMSCTGSLHSGACPGPASIRCCVP